MLQLAEFFSIIMSQSPRDVIQLDSPKFYSGHLSIFQESKPNRKKNLQGNTPNKLVSDSKNECYW